jgi:hypothetical protein
MTTFIVALVVVLLLVAGMAVGVLMGREPIKGSCGGIAALGIDTECEICGGNPNLCETEQQKMPHKTVRQTTFLTTLVSVNHKAGFMPRYSLRGFAFKTLRMTHSPSSTTKKSG